MDFTLTPEQEAFRDRVRTWLAANIPREWKAMASTEVPRPEAYELLKRWQAKLHEGGFIGVTWPKEYGGQGMTFMEEMILHQEMALQDGQKRRVGLLVDPLHHGVEIPDRLMVMDGEQEGDRIQGDPRRGRP